MNDYDVETDEYLKHGLRIFQSILFAPTEADHVLIYNHFTSPHGYVVDMGSGIGEMGALLEMINTGLSVINITNSKRQAEIMRQLNRKHTLVDYHQTGMQSGVADVVMFNETLGYGDCANLMEEASRLLKPGGMMILKDFTAKVEIDESFDLTGWGYAIHPMSEVLKNAEDAGLKMAWFFEPTGFEERYMKFFEASRMKEWHHTLHPKFIGMFAKFIKV